jgi:V/A-type H+-transporting ATPase subunit E
MKTLENENEKVNRICEHLRKEALEPAEKLAASIIQDAKTSADEIIQHAEKRADEILNQAKLEILREKKVFQSSLEQGAKQSLEMLRQEIAENLFNPQLESLIVKKTTRPEVIAEIIQALLQGIKTSGISGDIKAYIPHDVSVNEVNQLLLSEVIKTLEGQSVAIGNFKGGAKVKLMDKNIVLEMTDSALKELISEFIRADLRKYIFNV